MAHFGFMTNLNTIK